MDSLLISGRLHCQPSQQRERTTIEGHPTRGCTTALPAAVLRKNARLGWSPPPQGTTGGTGNAQPRPEKFHAHLKSPCLSTQRGRPTPEHDARANHLASPARADVQRQ